MKIETLNPEAVQSKGTARELAETPRRGVSAVPDIKSGDSLNISVNFPPAGKNLSVLLSSLIEMLNKLELHNVGAGLAPAPAQDGQPQGLPLLESLFYKGEEPLTFLKAFIENSGLMYEAKIAKVDIKGSEDDLKGLLLKLVEKSVGAGLKPAPTAIDLLQDIEARQLLNVKGKEEGVLYLQIPVLLPQGASTAEVYVRRDGKGKGGYQDDSYRIGFKIDLSEAGHVSIDALVNSNNASVTLKAENGEFLEFMESHLPELAERLSGYGMRLIQKKGIGNG